MQRKTYENTLCSLIYYNVLYTLCIVFFDKFKVIIRNSYNNIDCIT